MVQKSTNLQTISTGIAKTCFKSIIEVRTILKHLSLKIEEYLTYKNSQPRTIFTGSYKKVCFIRATCRMNPERVPCESI